MLGESDRAVVYLATSFELDALVALKVTRAGHDEVPPQDDGEAAVRAARQPFAREYEVLSSIHDPSIIDLYDYGVHDGLEYLAMEYFPRGDLKARMQRPLAAEEALDYVRRIARALGRVQPRLGDVVLDLEAGVLAAAVDIVKTVGLVLHRLQQPAVLLGAGAVVAHHALFAVAATLSFAAALALAEKVLAEGGPARERYLRFLSLGGTMFPIDELVEAGVDMRSPEPVTNAIRHFERLVDELGANHEYSHAPELHLTNRYNATGGPDYWIKSDQSLVRPMIEQSAAACRDADLLPELSHCLIYLGDERTILGEFALARRTLTEAVTLCKRLGDGNSQAMAMYALACLLALFRARPLRAMNVCDDRPLRMADYFEQAAEV